MSNTRPSRAASACSKPRRFSDVTDNVFYWNFVVLAWLPLYVLLDWVPRL
jgi:hypothetical protein